MAFGIRARRHRSSGEFSKVDAAFFLVWFIWGVATIWAICAGHTRVVEIEMFCLAGLCALALIPMLAYLLFVAVKTLFKR